MPVIGILTSKIDNRFLIALGFAMFGLSGCGSDMWTWRFRSGPSSGRLSSADSASGWSLSRSRRRPLPLPNEEIGNASGLYNLLRNVGGSIGISIVNTVVARHQQLHQNEMLHSLTPSDPNFQNQLQQLTQYLETQGYNSVDAAHKALGLIGGELSAQARLWSYVDDFRYLALVCFACIPVVFLLKKSVRTKGAQSIGH